MTRPEISSVVSTLESASDASVILTTILIIKKDVIGHEERKQEWVGAGVGRHLASIIATFGAAAGDSTAQLEKRLRRKNGRHREPEAHLQALILLGSLAYCRSCHCYTCWANLYQASSVMSRSLALTLSLITYLLPSQSARRYRLCSLPHSKQ